MESMDAEAEMADSAVALAVSMTKREQAATTGDSTNICTAGKSVDTISSMTSELAVSSLAGQNVC